MIIHRVEILAGRKTLRQAMMATRGKILSENCKPLSTRGTRKSILQRHGSLDRYEFRIIATVSDRCHSHLRTHNIINSFYQCSSSRPDLEHNTDASTRIIDFKLPLKRALEIYEIRLCGKAWIETFNFFDILAGYLEDLEPALRGLLLPKCAYHGYCTEGGCKYCQLDKYEMIKNEVKIYCGAK